MVVELISKDKEEKFQFQGRCKLTIDSVSKLLLVEPFNEEFKLISALFKWQFLAQKNILFVFAEYVFQDFAVIFDDSKKCNKVYEFLLKKGACSGCKEFITQRFVPSLVNTISTNNNDTTLKMKEILFQCIEQHHGKEKEEYMQLLKSYNVGDHIFENRAEEHYGKNLRKRRAQTRKHLAAKFIIEKPNFEMFSYEGPKGPEKRLIIFLDSSHQTCYEYSWNKSSRAHMNKIYYYYCYYCLGCAQKNHFIRAEIRQKKDGTEFVTIKSYDHVCEPRKYIPEKFGEKEIVQADKFQIFNENGMINSKLVIFTSSDKRKCYEYFWRNSDMNFRCCGCKRIKEHVTAKVCENHDGSKYVMLSRKKHACKPREYVPQKFETGKEVIEKSTFRIFQYKHCGTETSKLIIFNETNKNLCYEYYWNKSNQLYLCSRCPLKNRVTATLCQKEGIQDYVMLSKTPHGCDLLEFDREKYKDDIVVDKSLYTITSSTLRKIKNKIIIIFTSAEKKAYYKFIYHNGRKYYYCSKCYSSKVTITARIQNEGKENECVYLIRQKHVCEPLEYSALTNGNIIVAPNFQLIKRKPNGKIIQRLVVFTNEEKTECFEYTWNQKEINFTCYPCKSLNNIYVYARTFLNDKNEECVELCDIVHKCKPIKFIPENFVTKIVKAPNFKLFENVYNTKTVKKLAVFDSTDKRYGFIYTYSKGIKRYICEYCKKRKSHVFAKVLENDNGESYVELNDTEHVCEQKKL